MKQNGDKLDRAKYGKKGGKTKEKFALLAGRQVKGGPRDYFKVYSGGKKVKISEAEYDRLKGK
jgi:predicted proteasome-type protease